MGEKGFGDYNALPEDCVAIALSLTSPKDVCRLSAVNSTFRSASQSDTVWSRFLPSNYRDIISGAVNACSVSELAKFRSKKDLYLYLCDNPILIDGGTKSFSLEKSTGKKCYMLSTSELSFTVLCVDFEGWNYICLPESRFLEVLELQDVRSFDIVGNINIGSLSPSTNYAAYLVLTCKSRLYGVATVAMDKHHEGKKPQRWHGLNFQQLANMQRVEYPKQRSDGWMEVELGEYFVKEQNDGADLKLLYSEMKTAELKGGIIIQGIEIRPKNADS